MRVLRVAGVGDDEEGGVEVALGGGDPVAGEASSARSGSQTTRAGWRARKCRRRVRLLRG